jgi:hypothetical protein
MKVHASCAMFATLVFCAVPAFAQDGEGCSHDTLTVDGVPVEVTVCPAGRARDGEAGTLTLVETFSGNGESFSRNATLEALGPGEASRMIDDVSLQPLHLGRTLHMTIRYRARGLRLEHAMLVPGAITLK